MKGYKTGGRRPGSKNKVPPAIKAIALAMVPDANKTLRSLLKGAPDAVRVRCIEIVYERAFGKPRQEIEHSGALGVYDPSKLTTDELRTVIAILERASADGADGVQEGTGEA
ncbi:hypothetical protein [Bradyrhizobium sp. Tv2a-2]|uniref:hypothetical protein n=1 Tax=Bradyrhizobium sp. Tv2a-2 TaxID=113395 RepID=UPI0004674D94|nr:hypothetical protein [Bradyrhizobium sp. Tv2a-2]